MAMTQRALTLNIQPIAAPCIRHSATGKPVTIFASRLNVILRRLVYHRAGNFPGDSGTIPDSPGHAGGKKCPIQMLSTGPFCGTQPTPHAVFRAPDRPARTIPASKTPATTLSNADPAGDLSGDGGVIQFQKTPAGDGGGQKFYGVKPVPEVHTGNVPP